ncbi:hypothetical protein M885DRAFT_526444 [Pelagophyceae sp. CCMP2097]|nr:hypothetical protein M885DRAFT_526444 [Pelagophyceae sp. CCMP2097]
MERNDNYEIPPVTWFSEALARANEDVWPSSERAPALPLPALGASPAQLLDGLEGDVAGFLAALPARWVAQERAFLALVAAECAHDLRGAPDYVEAYGERRLIRFLRQAKTPEKGLAACHKYLRWRCDQGVDDVRAAIAGGLDDPRDWPNGLFFLNRCCVLPCSTALFDVKGNALCVEQYGHWPAHKLRDLTPEGYLEWHTYGLEWKMMLLERIALGREKVILRAAFQRYMIARAAEADAPAAAAPAGQPAPGRRSAVKQGLVPGLGEGWGEIPRLCTIFDQTGMTFSHAMLPCGLRMCTMLISIVQKYYPWLQDTTHLTNTSAAIVTVMKMVRPVLPKHTQRKIFIHGVGAATLEGACIRPDFLPTALGGRAACAEMTPPPSSDDCAAMLAGGVQTQSRVTTPDGEPQPWRRRTSGRGADAEDAPKDDAPTAASARQADGAADDAAADATAAGSADAVEAALPEPSIECTVFIEKLAAGLDVVVGKHGRRGRSDRRLKFSRDVLILLPKLGRKARRWRCAGGPTTRVMALDTGSFVARQGAAAPPLDKAALKPWQQAAHKHASACAPNYVVLANDAKMLTLELQTEELAAALVDFVYNEATLC